MIIIMSMAKYRYMYPSTATCSLYIASLYLNHLLVYNNASRIYTDCVDSLKIQGFVSRYIIGAGFPKKKELPRTLG